MGVLPESARAVLESDALAHLVTVNRDGSPQVSIVWVGLDGDELLSGHLLDQQKLRNVRRDPRVALTFETQVTNPLGLREYLIVHGRATVEEGGAPELLQELAHTYLGPGVRFPRMPDPPPGFRLRVTVDRIGGVGPWTEAS
jgi:PPOX class probable F420-dependent enzyme